MEKVYKIGNIMQAVYYLSEGFYNINGVTFFGVTIAIWGALFPLRALAKKDDRYNDLLLWLLFVICIISFFIFELPKYGKLIQNLPPSPVGGITILLFIIIILTFLLHYSAKIINLYTISALQRNYKKIRLFLYVIKSFLGVKHVVSITSSDKDDSIDSTIFGDAVKEMLQSEITIKAVSTIYKVKESGGKQYNFVSNLLNQYLLKEVNDLECNLIITHFSTYANLVENLVEHAKKIKNENEMVVCLTQNTVNFKRWFNFYNFNSHPRWQSYLRYMHQLSKDGNVNLYRYMAFTTDISIRELEKKYGFVSEYIPFYRLPIVNTVMKIVGDGSMRKQMISEINSNSDGPNQMSSLKAKLTELDSYAPGKLLNPTDMENHFQDEDILDLVELFGQNMNSYIHYSCSRTLTIDRLKVDFDAGRSHKNKK